MFESPTVQTSNVRGRWATIDEQEGEEVTDLLDPATREADRSRFSVTWTDIQPDGAGPINHAGLDSYDRLVDNLLKDDIEPCLTLYCRALPPALEAVGGWSNPSIVDHFVDYAGAVAARLGDRVQHWTTINEPLVGTDHSDGRDSDTGSHHLLMAHGAAVHVIRAHAPGSEVGIALGLAEIKPAQRRRYVEALATGRYPSAGAVEKERAGDLRVISRPIDFLNVTTCSPEKSPKVDDVVSWLKANYEFPSVEIVAA